MIQGVVTPGLEATIGLRVVGPNGAHVEVIVVIDTGFTGFLTLPPNVISALNLSFIGRQQVMLGDGSVELFDVYTGIVDWDGQPCPVEVDAADTDPLLGMSLLYGFEFSMQTVDGGLVTITRL